MSNEFLPFATGGGANVEAQATYSADSDRTNGNQPGIARSALNNKALRQATVVASQLAQFLANAMNINVVDDGNTANLLSQLTAALVALPPVRTTYGSGSGNHNCSAYFFCTAANVTVGATYSHNSGAFTAAATYSGATMLRFTGSVAPLSSGTLTKTGGTGDATITFQAVRTPISIGVIMSAGGGGGGASGGCPSSGGTGGNTTVGTTGLMTASGGSGGSTLSSTTGAAGGAASLGTIGSGIAIQGGRGGGSYTNSGTLTSPAGAGGNNALGGGAGLGCKFGGSERHDKHGRRRCRRWWCNIGHQCVRRRCRRVH